ncbi:MAG: (2Fe-2S)-binding protein, partial [Bdellovibrionales bacterium]|nr:(2Fe-2S)-binding protein [Bdellovibrionales bacterium]
MLGPTAFFNASATLPEIGLFLDIDPKNDCIKDFFFDGPKSSHYKLELEELRILAINKNLSEVKKIIRTDLSFEVLLENSNKATAPIGLWLLQKAISGYEGEARYYREQSDMVCLCFSITKKDIVKKVLSNKDFELKTLIQDTMASSACGTCRKPIEKIILETRLSHGLIKGLDHSKSRFDEKGEWLKVAGFYPGELLIKLEELKQEWMKREEIADQFKIEFTDIEGLHLTL